MKTKIFTLLIVVMGVMTSMSASAAGVANPSPGQSTTYSVTSTFTIPGTGYEWHIYENGTTTEASSAYSGTLGTGNSITVTWTAASAGNQYDVWVQATDENGCLTDPQIFDVTVSTPILCIATSSTGDVGGDSTAAPVGTTACSILTTDATGFSGTGSAGEETTFYATLTGGAPSSSYTVTYTIASTLAATATVTTTATLSTDTNGAGALAITVASTDYTAHFDAVSGDNTVTIAVTEATIGAVTVSNTCADNDYTVTVKQLPTITF